MGEKGNMPKRRYTAEEKEERKKMIRRMYADGKSTNAIGRTLGLSGGTVWLWLKEDGVQLRGTRGGNSAACDIEELKKLAEEGRTKKEIADRLYVSERTVDARLKQNGIKINLEARAEKRREKKEKDSHRSSRQKPEKKCGTCRFRSGNTVYGCNYSLIKKQSRRCSVTECTRYEKGRRIRLKEEYADV